MKLSLLAFLVQLALWSGTGAAPARTYTTRFPLAENPISENGNWTNGKKNGLDWSDVSTTNGLAIGLESGFSGYDDATALLTGSWGPNQTASATVYTTNRKSGNVFEEVEIRLRSSLSAHRCTGYEVLFSLKPDSSAYVQIVRWNGALGDFTYVAATGGAQYILKSGDTISASITNQTITAYINGAQALQGTDTNYPSGNPGIGIFIQGASGLNGDYGLTSFTVTDHATGPVYPLKPSANGRYLVDQNNSPCLLQGDSPQALIVNLSEADADAFFADRQSYGFNSVWINLLCATYTGGRADATTFDGIRPFTNNISGKASYDLAAVNEAYFAHVDRILNLAAQHGIQVFLDPAETGSFLSVMLDNGTNKCRAYGRFLGQRYHSFPNIIWMSGNDFQTWRSSADDAVVLAVAAGIKDFDTAHLHTSELDYVVSSSLDDTNWNSILGLNATYTYYPTYARLQQDYNRANFLPTFLVEANYEFESLQGPVTTAPILRKQEYWTMTSGACGQLYGNHYTWPFSAGWQGYLDTVGAAELSYLKAFFDPRAWYNLIPDTNHTVVTSGFGTFSSTGHVADNNYLTAARTSDGSLVVAYTPLIQPFTVDLSRLSGPAVTRWFDPAAGLFVSIAGSPFTNSGTRTFTPPRANSDGDGGWVLVLETNPPPDAPPPPPKPKVVQQAYATPQTPLSQVTVEFSAAQTAGSGNLVAIGWNDAAASISSVGDSAGNVYQEAVPTFRGNGLSQAIWYAANIKAETNSITVTFDRPAAYVDLRASEYSGLASTNAFSGGNSTAGTGTSAASGPVSITASNELLFAAGMTSAAFTSSGPGFTTRMLTAPDSDIVEDQISAAPGNYNATATLSSGSWLMQMAAMKSAAPAASPPSLKASLTATNTILLAWPASSAGFVLQQTVTLAPQTWGIVTNSLEGTGSVNQAVLSLIGFSQFYRLIQQ